MTAAMWAILAAVALPVVAIAVSVTFTLLTEYAWRHRATLAAEYRALAALRGGRHARTLSRPHLTLTSHGTHRRPLGRHEQHHTREALAA